VPANLIDAALAAYARAIRILDPIRFQVWAARGITMPQVRVLFMLAESGDQSAGDIADTLGVAASTVTGITDRLVRQCLIERREDTADRRVVRLTLTADGRRLTTEVGEVSRTYLREVFALLSDEQLEVLVRSFENLADANARVASKTVAV